MDLSGIPCSLANATSNKVKSYFQNSYDVYEDLFRGIIDEEAFFKYPDALRLPLIFYYGHTAAVYVNKLVLAGLIERVKFDYESLFETGVDEMSWDNTENFRMGDKYVWPTVPEVEQYRQDVREAILNLIDTKPMEVPVTQDSPWWSLFMGMEHERIHMETSSVLIRQLPVKYVQRPPNWVYGPSLPEVPVTKNPMLKVHNATVTVGKPHDFPSYGWDNEYGEWTVRVPEFEASKYLVTNREFLEFVKAGGYRTKKYWSDDGWHWLSFRKAKHPTFWVCHQGCNSGCGNDLASYSHCCLATDHNQNDVSETNGHHNGVDTSEYKYRAMFDVIGMPLDWPAEVNHYEAKAYCAWKGPDYRLLTEAEHHVIRGPQKPVSMGTECDAIHRKDFKANINLRFASSTPVNLFPANEAGFHDVFGNVWCWVEDHFNGLPGFQTHYLYDDFSTPTFDGHHFVIMGGSWIATGAEASRFARYAFRPHFFQHLGFRLARSVSSTPPPVRLVSTKVFVLGQGQQENPAHVPGIEEGQARLPSTNIQYAIDTQDIVCQDALEQYGDLFEETDETFTDICIGFAQQYDIQTNTVLCVLCSVGRPAFELSKHFEKVIGVDYSGRVLEVALKLQNGEELQIRNSHNDVTIQIPDDVNADRVVFKQLTWLPNEIGKYDLIAFSGLERVASPKAWLARLREVIHPDGLVIIKTFKGLGTDEIQDFLGERFCMIAEKEIINSCPAMTEGIRRSDRCHSSATAWRLVTNECE